MAVPWPQHSPMFGQRASWQTVWSPRSSTARLTLAYCGPPPARILSHSGLRGRDLHRYLRDLETVLIRALGEFGIRAERAAGLTGVWVGDGKVAAIGIRVSRWIAHHGFALNVATDLSFFDLIVPCGIADRRVTSMEALLGRPVDRESVEAALGRAFRAVFAEAEVRGGAEVLAGAERDVPR